MWVSLKVWRVCKHILFNWQSNPAAVDISNVENRGVDSIAKIHFVWSHAIIAQNKNPALYRDAVCSFHGMFCLVFRSLEQHLKGGQTRAGDTVMEVVKFITPKGWFRYTDVYNCSKRSTKTPRHQEAPQLRTEKNPFPKNHPLKGFLVHDLNLGVIFWLSRYGRQKTLRT